MGSLFPRVKDYAVAPKMHMWQKIPRTLQISKFAKEAKKHLYTEQKIWSFGKKNMMLFKQKNTEGLKKHRVPPTVEPFTTIELTFDLIGLVAQIHNEKIQQFQVGSQPPGNG